MISILFNQKGSALLIALMLLGMLSLLGLAAIDKTNTDIDLAGNDATAKGAFYVAEAGVKMALVTLNTDDTWRAGFTNVKYGGGFYTVTLVDSTGDSTLFDTVLITSTAVVDGGAAAVEYETIPVYKTPFSFGLFADAGIFFDRNTCTDSYNSDSGTYATTVLDSMGDIGSNGTIGSSKDVNFGGSINVATAGGITLGSGNVVNGDTSSTVDSVDLDLIPSSEYDWARTNSIATIGITGSGFTYNNGTKDLTAGSYSNIVLSSGVYYFNDISLGQGSNLSLAPGANVTIYVNGDIHLDQASTMNDGGAPSDLMIFSRGSALTFNQDNIFYGAFYGPNAHIQYDQTTQAFGSLVGNTIKLDKGACFHFDRMLGSFTKGTTGEMIAVAWIETL
ncbi:MAG: hypothetical protein KOO62_05255 [candidate division Zixibacteria bacterium]|nr:hypothetical protein [candidate division Zixibacteria bacterium]